MTARRPLRIGYLMAGRPLPSDLTAFTHVSHAFAEVSLRGALTLPSPEISAAFVAQAKRQRVVPILSVGGAGSGEGFRAAMASAEKRAALVDTLADAVNGRGYGGLDIDWEAPESADDGRRFTELARALRRRAPKALLTSATPALEWGGKHYEVDALKPLLDYVLPMTYDFSGPWSPTAGHNADLPTVERSIAFWTGRGWPVERLLVGIPLYGRGFAVRAWGEKPTGAAEHGEITYADAIALQWPERADATAKAIYREKPGGGELISLESAATVAAKVRMARDRGLAGYFFWEITQDTVGGKRVLVDAARAAWP